jgi:hypothetical protein
VVAGRRLGKILLIGEGLFRAEIKSENVIFGAVETGAMSPIMATARGRPEGL